MKLKSAMNKNNKLTLIKGNFSNEEASEILVNLISSKISFHQLKNFSSQEQFGKEDKIANKRIPALKKELEKLKKILLVAKKKNTRLLVSSEINITLLED